MGAQWKAKGKALVADAKGKLFGKLVKEITVAARGGADPASNSRLRLVVEQARKASMPKDTLERAIKKGSGTGADAVSWTPPAIADLEREGFCRSEGDRWLSVELTRI